METKIYITGKRKFLKRPRKRLLYGYFVANYEVNEINFASIMIPKISKDANKDLNDFFGVRQNMLMSDELGKQLLTDVIVNMVDPTPEISGKHWVFSPIRLTFKENLIEKAKT